MASRSTPRNTARNLARSVTRNTPEASDAGGPSQISATISSATREKLDRFTTSHGLKKNFVVEQALLFFMEARRELPDDAFIPARLVLADQVFDSIVELLEHPPAPTKALRELMRGKGR